MKSRVTLEPELEKEAATLTAGQRVQLAKKLERWARQLRVSAFILRLDAQPRPRPSVKPLSRRKLALN